MEKKTGSDFLWTYYDETTSLAITEEGQKLIRKMFDQTKPILPETEKKAERTLGSLLWSFRPDVGWFDSDGDFRGLKGDILKPSKGKQIFSDIDPYGEEKWEE